MNKSKVFRSIPIVVFISVVILSLSGYFLIKRQTINTLRVYRNETYGFKFSYPAKWQVKEFKEKLKEELTLQTDRIFLYRGTSTQNLINPYTLTREKNYVYIIPQVGYHNFDITNGDFTFIYEPKEDKWVVKSISENKEIPTNLLPEGFMVQSRVTKNGLKIYFVRLFDPTSINKDRAKDIIPDIVIPLPNNVVLYFWGDIAIGNDFYKLLDSIKVNKESDFSNVSYCDENMSNIEIKNLLPSDTELVEQAKVDFNGNGIKDLVLFYSKPGDKAINYTTAKFSCVHNKLKKEILDKFWSSTIAKQLTHFSVTDANGDGKEELKLKIWLEGTGNFHWEETFKEQNGVVKKFKQI
jgi:hypothetical protein